MKTKGRINRVNVVDGSVIKRPANQQRNPENWADLREQRRALQTADGKVYCGTCAEVEGGPFRFELHHRLYNQFGQERIEDVILLCEPCHDAITSRIRTKRYAAGDMSITVEFSTAEEAPRYVPQARRIEVKVEQKTEPARPAFRPTSRKHG
jgi:hypothetical protein